MNLKNKKNRDRVMDTQSVSMVARRKGVWGNGLKGEGITKYKIGSYRIVIEM